MKAETKLKDMTNFLENVYKDIKEQPTIEEEQKQEKEFINKIKGNNTNEIKEILDDLKYVSNEIKAHIQDGNIKAKEIPSSLGKELRLNNYSAKILLDYITNLQEEINSLHIINDENRYLIDDNKQRIDKAVEYIEEDIKGNYFKRYEDEVYKMCDDLLDILRGDE